MAIRFLFYTFIILISTSAQNSSRIEEGSNQSTQSSTSPAEDDQLMIKLTPEWKDKGASYYRTPKGASRGVKGVNIPYTLWYDGIKWSESTPLNVNAEKSFEIKDKNIYSIIVTDNKHLTLNDIDSIVIENAKKSGFEHAEVLSLEKRNVNGIDVIFVHWSAKLQNTHADFLSYLYSDAKGSVFIHTYTPTKLFNKNQREMEDFLNGFTLDTQENTEKGNE